MLGVHCELTYIEVFKALGGEWVLIPIEILLFVSMSKLNEATNKLRVG